MTYTYNHSSRSVEAILVGCFGIILAVFCAFLVVTTSIGVFGFIFSLLGLCAAAYSIYFFLRSVSWQVEVSGQGISWHSPHMPRENRVIPLAEIAAARAFTGDPPVLELHLISGEIISLPSPCVGRHPERALDALRASNPQIKVIT